MSITPTPASSASTAERVRALQADLERAGLRRLAVTFVNHAGQALVKVAPLATLEAVACQGLGFSPVADAFAADGGIDPRHPLARPDGDLRLLPDLAALRPLDPAGGWAWAPGERHRRGEGLYEADQRGFCRRRQERLAAAGFTLRAGFELEWVVGVPDGRGGWRPGVLGGPYGADRLVDGLDYIAAVADALDAAGLPWLQLHPEYGAGQFELSLAPAEPLQAADRLVAARLLIQRQSRRFGLLCSFAPVLEPGQVGNGGHLHLSLAGPDGPLLQGGGGPGGLTPAGEAVLATVLEHLPALLPLACPLELSYQRLAPGRWSAPFQAWGVENREAALRLVPAAADGSPAHLELKVADAAANPYLLMGAVLALLEAGLERPLPVQPPLPPPVAGDPARLGTAAPPRLPASLAEASAAFAGSALLRAALGNLLHASVLETQRAEQRRAAALGAEALLASSRWTPANPFLSQ
jgi:glutamine synthetase